MKRKFFYLSLFLFLMQSCSWDSTMYDEFVSDGVVVSCPPRMFEYNGKLVTYQITGDGIEPVPCDRYGKILEDQSQSIDIDQDAKDGNYYLTVSEKERWRLYSWEEFEAYFNQQTPMISYILTPSLESCQNENTGCYDKCINGDCLKFEKSFLYGICPNEANSCEFKNNEFFCRPRAQSCQAGEHLYGDTCEKDSLKYCGSHENDCEKLAGWREGICDETGVCKASDCQDNYHLISEQGRCEADTHECCGTNCISCSATDKCELGSCKAVCEKGTHIYGDACEEDSSAHCGSHENDCTKLAGWKDGTCDEMGGCQAIACQDNYHLISDVPGVGRCEPDTHDCCGLDCKTCSSAEKCELGECKTVCEKGSHIFENACEEDSFEHCGSHENDCTKLAGWKDGICDETGFCKASVCQDNYHLISEQGRCEADTHECCGMDCKSCTASELCQNGVCESVCAQDEHIYGDGCELNSLFNCGTHDNNCARDVAGWMDGDCIEGKCVPNSCVVGYHLKNNTCIGDDSENCGREGRACLSGQVCLNGQCNSNCGDKLVLCISKDGSSAKCIDPSTSIEYCGADHNCSNYTPCTNGKICADGSCVQQTCTDSAQTLCTIKSNNNLTYTCINVNDGNKEHCGGCNYNCADHPLANASSTSCSSGKCQYSCSKGYSNCGTNTAPECISKSHLNTDPNHCGSCAKKCSEDEFCSDGKCYKSSCTASNKCLDISKHTCVESDTQCGVQCINCNTANHASVGKCSNGKCTIAKCEIGYHLSNGKCEANTDKKCAPVDSSNTINCNSYNHAESGVCTNGTCTATSCADNYHLNNGSCVKDTTAVCGSGKTDCTKLAGWNNGSCSKGKCVANSCKTGYCLNTSTGTCVDGTANSKACGSQTECKICSNNYSCVKATCVLSSCASNICFYQGKTCENTTTHCGKNCTNCNTANDASSGTCKNGSCVITSCAKGFHLMTDGTCAENKNTSCGSRTEANAVNCNINGNASSGVCTVNGTCLILACANNYHLSENTCVKDSVKACGPDAVNCTKEEGWNSGNCINGSCSAKTCKNDYCLLNGTCIKGKQNAYACGMNSEACVACSASQYCSNGQCKNIPSSP